MKLIITGGEPVFDIPNIYGSDLVEDWPEVSKNEGLNLEMAPFR